jgi:hypothetical protein
MKIVKYIVIFTLLILSTSQCSVRQGNFKRIKILPKQIEEYPQYQTLITQNIINKNYEALLPHVLTEDWEQSKKKNITPAQFFFEKLHLNYSSNLNYTFYVEEKMNTIVSINFHSFRHEGRFLFGEQYTLRGILHYNSGENESFYLNILFLNKDFKFL